MAKLERPSPVLYPQWLALALTIASTACHDDRRLGEIVEPGPPSLCGGAPCNGWCDRPLGACDAPSARGVCRPFLSSDERDALLMTCIRNPPMDEVVCGCDGQTYRFDCQRVIAEVSPFRAGACNSPTCRSPTDCAAGEFCESRDGVCSTQGTCQPGGPDATAVRCPSDTGPVCGCDRKTYPSECGRRQAGVSKSRDGPCER